MMSGFKLRYIGMVFCLLVISIISSNAFAQELDYQVFLPLISLPTPPDPFDKYSPADGATDQDLMLGLWWVSSEWATNYEYCIDTSNDNACSSWISTGINNYAVPPQLNPSTTYFWQVRAWNGSVGPTYANGDPHSFWSFATLDLNPAPFVKYSPVDGATDQDLVLGLWWVPSERATRYEYCMDTTNDNSCYEWISTGADNYVVPPELTSYTTYYWQVRAWNGTYGPTYADGSPTAFWSFRTKDVFPSPFNKFSPQDGAINQDLVLGLWWVPAERVTNYEYCIDTSNDNSCSNWISAGINNYAVTPQLSPNATYYWQIRAWNGTYGPTYADGSANSYWSFTTAIMIPGAFNKLSPDNGYDGTTMSPVLSWNTSTNATKYEYCYDTSNDGTCSNWISTGTNNWVGLSGLQAGTTYYWQVRAWNGTYGPTYANGSTNAYWSFTTLTTGVWIMDNCSLYESASGSYMYFVCEIYNNTTTGAEYFSIDVDLYDANGNLIGTDYGYGYLSIIHPQETACIDVMFQNLPNFEYLYYYGSYYETTDRRPSLSISNHSGHPGSYAYETLGIITNNSASTVQYVNAVASLYINSGLVVGCDSGYINLNPPDLAPGQQSSFDTYTWLPDPYAVTNYKLQADGWIGTLNSLDETTGEKMNALGGNKTMRIMDWAMLFHVGPQK